MLEKIKKKLTKNKPTTKNTKNTTQTLPYTVKKDTAPAQRNNTKGFLSTEYVKHTKKGTKTYIGNPYNKIIFKNEHTPIIDISTDTNPTLGFKRLHALNSLDLGKIYEK